MSITKTKIGCHVSIAGGIVNAPKRAVELGCEVFQIFTRSPRGGAASRITPEIAKSFKAEMAKWGQANCYIHTPYYINFASSNKAIRDASVRIVREELERGTLIGAKYIMTHLGSSGDLARQEALKITAEGIKKTVKNYKGTTQLLLEISAGAGNIMGDTFEELEYFIKNSSDKINVCIDSAHMFATGYDIKTESGMNNTIKIIKSTVRKSKVKLIHANDSKIDLGGRRDRHDHIGMGKIGESGFVNLMENFPNIDLILETEPDLVKKDIEKLKLLRSRA